MITGLDPGNGPDVVVEDHAVAGPGGIRIVPATSDQLEPILLLEAAGFTGAERWSRQSWQSELEGPAFRVLAAGDGRPGRSDRMLGVAAIRLTGDTADLDRIMVAPDARRRGVGTVLITAALELAADAGAGSMLLEVDSDNRPAVALYRSLGFTELTLRTDYYGPGRNAMIMTRPVERRNR